MVQKVSSRFFREVLSFLTYRQKIAFVGLFCIFLISGLLNVVAYTLVGPLIGMASGVTPDLAGKLGYYLYPIIGESHFILRFSLFVLAFQFFRIGTRVFSSFLSILFIRRVIASLLSRVLKSNINLSYVDYQKKDFHKVNRDLSFVNRYGGLLTDILDIFANTIILVGYVSLLFLLSWKITSFIFVYFAIMFVLFQVIFKRLIRSYGQEANQAEMRQTRSATLLFRNFKFIKTRGESVEILQNQYVENGLKVFLRRSFLGIFQVLNSSLIELSGIVILIGLVIYFNYFAGGIAGQLGILSIYAISFYRMVPILNEMLSIYQRMIEQKNTTDILVEALRQTQEPISYEGDPLSFQEKIVFSHVNFAYQADKPILQDISFEIKKGDRIGVVGESGTGKTTLGDVLIGLLQVDSGTITVDGIPLSTDNLGRWRKSIGYIPQSIFLFDGTVAENVAFDQPIHEEKLEATLKRAQIWDFLSQKEGIKTKVTLDGSSLSGGQRQRLGIARSFYSGAELIVLDEATSALDTQTEAQIMREIYSMKEDTTLFIIAHRLSTLDQCNKIIHMERGHIKTIEMREVLP
jgi:ABC-type bacteriocin/lantibiotic exporter with double-glycine peptidase domain